MTGNSTQKKEKNFPPGTPQGLYEDNTFFFYHANSASAPLNGELVNNNTPFNDADRNSEEEPVDEEKRTQRVPPGRELCRTRQVKASAARGTHSKRGVATINQRTLPLFVKGVGENSVRLTGGSLGRTLGKP